MTTYLDTSVVVALFTADIHTERAKRVVAAGARLVVSDMTAAEFSSALAIHYRNGRATEKDVRTAFTMFDAWYETLPERAEVSSSDVRGAEALIRQLDHALRAPDAMHLMIARRLGISLASFDRVMAESARRLGVEVVDA